MLYFLQSSEITHNICDNNYNQKYVYPGVEFVVTEAARRLKCKNEVNMELSWRPSHQVNSRGNWVI